MDNTEKKVLGVIGGLGPAATAHFMDTVTRMTDANCDQEHIDMILYSFPSIPDRTAHILDSSNPDPGPHMASIAKRLAEQGADYIAIPCMTAHYFCDMIQSGISIPIINGITQTASYLKDAGIERVGIMATDGTVQTRLFQKAIQDQAMTAVLPSPQRQPDIMHLIYGNLKANLPPDMEKFYTVRKELQDHGVQAIILGCTELSLIKRDHSIGPGFIDAMEVLAHQSILHCGGKLKDEYRSLITK